MKSCSQCGHVNDLGAPICARCGFRFAPPPVPRQTREFPTVFVIILLLSAGTAAAKFAVGRVELRGVQARLAAGMPRYPPTEDRASNTTGGADSKQAAGLESADNATHADPGAISQ